MGHQNTGFVAPAMVLPLPAARLCKSGFDFVCRHVPLRIGFFSLGAVNLYGSHHGRWGPDLTTENDISEGPQGAREPGGEGALCCAMEMRTGGTFILHGNDLYSS